MGHPGFWAPAGPFSLSKLASYAGAEIPEVSTAEAGRSIRSVKALDVAGASDVSFLDNRKYLTALKQPERGPFLSPPPSTQAAFRRHQFR